MQKSLTAEYQKKFINDYHKKIAGTGFSSRGSRTRYDEITKIIENNTKIDQHLEILEYGCGPSGGLIEYTTSLLFPIRFNISQYVGYDINSSYVESSNKKYPHIQPGYHSEINPHTYGKYDVVLASGIFCYDYNEAYWTNKELIYEMTQKSKDLVIVNFLPDKMDKTNLDKEILTYTDNQILAVVSFLEEAYGKRIPYEIHASSRENNITLVIKKKFDREIDE